MPDLSLDDQNELSRRSRARERFRNVMLQELLIALSASGLSRASLARRINRRPEQITRWLSAPGNLEIDTISDLLVAMNVSPESIIRPREHAPASSIAAELLFKLQREKSVRSQLVLNATLSSALSRYSTINQASADQSGATSLPQRSERRFESNKPGVLSRLLAKRSMEAA